MSLFTKSANDVFSPINADGTLRGPSPQDAQRWGTEIELSVLGGSAGSAIFTNKETMDLNLAYPQHTMAWVISDETVGNNGIYRKIGASGAGSWERRGDLPFGFIRATNAGAGTANAIQATTSLPIPSADGAALIALPIVVDITGSATVSFNGATALPIKRASGEDVAAGDLRSGMIVAGYVSGGTFRLLNHFGVQFLLATNTGGVNAITATTPTAVPSGDGAALILLPISATNTASPVTVSFNGGSALTIKTYDGSDPEPGGLTAGMIIAGYKSGTTFRMLSDQSRAALVAAINAAVDAAEAAQEAAETAQAGAEGAKADAEAARDIAAGYASDAVSQGNVPIYATVAGMGALSVPSAINALRVNGHNAAGDGGAALYKKVGSEPSHDGKFQSADGAWWEISETTINPLMFGAKADGVIDDTAAIQSAVDFVAALGGGRLKFPKGRYLINSGATDISVRVEGHKVTLDFEPGAVLVKNVADRQLIIVGANATDGNRVKGFRIYGGYIENNAADSSNNFSHIQLLYVEDAIVSGLGGENVGTAIRAGWNDAFSDPRAKGIRVQNCRFINPKYNCIEIFGVEGGFVHNNEIIGGANSGSVECRAIRVVASIDVEVTDNRTKGTGCGIHINTSVAAGALQNILVANNICSGHTHLGAFKVDYDVNRLTVVGNQFLGSGGNYAGPLCLIDSRSGDESTDLLWADNLCIGDGTESDILRINFCNRGTIKGGKIQHVGGGLASTHYGVRLVSCGEMWDIDTVIEMDDNNARAIRDVTGLASLDLRVAGSFKMDTASGALNFAVSQDTSLGRVRLGQIIGNVEETQVISSDGTFALSPFSSPKHTFHTGTLTVNRAVTLSTTNAFPGMEFKITRTGGGAFTLNVGTGPLKAMPTNSWAVFKYTSAGAWALAEYGTL